MPSAALALISSVALLQYAAAGGYKDLGLGDKCKKDWQCGECLTCAKGYTGKLGKTVMTCQADPDQVGFSCLGDNGKSGTCEASGICEFDGSGYDPHLYGLRGQAIDWKGEDGGWYAIISDSADVQISVRLTAPLPEDFPERQLITAVAVKYPGGHSVVIENTDPYDTDTPGCPDSWFAPCLSEGAIRIKIDGEEHQAMPVESLPLPGQATMTSVNLPVECQPYGGDRIWARRFAAMTTSRRRLIPLDTPLDTPPTFADWAQTWAQTATAPKWCQKFLDEAGAEGALRFRGKHSVFRIETPAFTLRVHHGTNHQGGEVLEDGRVLPELEFWQVNLHLENYTFDPETVTGLLGETSRPVRASDGEPIMSGSGAIRGEVEDYRISGPLETDFSFFHD